MISFYAKLLKHSNFLLIGGEAIFILGYKRR
jgi:hypothetical protein